MSLIKDEWRDDKAGVRLILGDCLDVLPTLGGIDAVVTDPPYGTGRYRTDDAATVVECLQGFQRKAVFGYPETLCRWCQTWGVPDEWVTWWPTNKPVRRYGRLTSEHEAIAIWGPTCEVPMRPRRPHRLGMKLAAKRGLSTSEAKQGDVWRDASPGMAFQSARRRHPNEKPEALMIRLVRLCSRQGETVADPYMGSGTTGVACLQSGRGFVGVEIDRKFWKIAVARVRAAIADSVSVDCPG